MAAATTSKKKRPKPGRQDPEKAYERPPFDKMVRSGQYARKGKRPRRSKPHG